MFGAPTLSIVGFCKPVRTPFGFLFSVGHFADSSIDITTRHNELGFWCEAERKGAELKASLPNHDDWFHIACVTDGQTMRTYVDGKLVAEAPISVARIHNGNVSAHTARIGAQAKEKNRKDRYYKGLLDEFAIFKRVLSEREIKALCSVRPQQRDSKSPEDAGASEPDLGVFSRDPSELSPKESNSPQIGLPQP
jgi:hypothetical protein